MRDLHAETELVKLAKIVDPVLMIVAHAFLVVEMGYVMEVKHVVTVLATVELAQLSAEMVYVPRQQNPVIHALATAEHVPQQCGVVTAHVITVKTVILVGQIVGPVPKCHGVVMVNVITVKPVIVVQQIVERVRHIVAMVPVMVSRTVVTALATAEPVLLSNGAATVHVITAKPVVTVLMIADRALHQIHFAVTAFVTEKKIVRHVLMIVEGCDTYPCDHDMIYAPTVGLCTTGFDSYTHQMSYDLGVLP